MSFSDEDVIDYLVSQCISLQGMITGCSVVIEWRLVYTQYQRLGVHAYSQSPFSICTPYCICNKLLLSLLVIHYKENRRNIASKTCEVTTLDSIPQMSNREFKKTTTGTATGTLLNKTFNEQNNGCARAL